MDSSTPYQGTRSVCRDRKNHQQYNSVHLDPRYSDLTTVCEDDKYAVHKCTVRPRSAFFAKNIRATSIKGMTEHLYHLDYKVPLHCLETDVLTRLDNYTSDTDTDTTQTPSEPVEDPANRVDLILVHILMYTPTGRILIEGMKEPSKDDQGLRDMVIKIPMDNSKELKTAQVAPSAFPESLVRSTPQYASDSAVVIIERTVSNWQSYEMCRTDWNEDY
ncbi:hypothetical protein N7447_000188 [Penicillium robsamsonii]|uniref:uncharacterized protein n=1 Tax=Penicillium robsamsonii TaxID=1792511 RepID=UPI00254972EC|nr:uncharacterized protein N7447_000188 [Penicillium robsamsonii]KAJ5834162.1 hypothetical protein N7447_000188 [Penicillium robsamsonii]